MRIKRIHHITLAVGDLDGARLTFEQLFGARGSSPATDVPAFGVRVLDMPFGDTQLRLATPGRSANPLMRFLQRRGEGFYNIAIEVDDLDAAVDELASQGVAVSEPIEAEPGMRSSFVTMSATHGLSLQLVEIATSAPPAPISKSTLDPMPQPVAAPPATPPTTTEQPARPDHLPEGDQDVASDPAPEASRPGVLDLTPDEWSDTD
jgi:methylmalonyl-CoA/ethylmalonyl-CoA epimerase